MKLTDQSAFEAATSLATAGGGAAAGAGAAYITSAARYNERGQMRGFQFDGQHGQAAAIDAGVAFGGAYLGSALSKAGMGTLAGGYLGGKAASAIGETYKYYNLNEEYHGGYHAMRNADLGAGLSGAASALLGEFNEGIMAGMIAGLGYSHEENKRVRADVRSGGSLLDRGISGLGGSAFGQRIGNLFNYGMWETDLSLYDRVREETIRIKSRGGDVGEELGWREQSYIRAKLREFIEMHPEQVLTMYIGPRKTGDIKTPKPEREAQAEAVEQRLRQAEEEIRVEQEKLAEAMDRYDSEDRWFWDRWSDGQYWDDMYTTRAHRWQNATPQEAAVGLGGEVIRNVAMSYAGGPIIGGFLYDQTFGSTAEEAKSSLLRDDERSAAENRAAYQRSQEIVGSSNDVTNVVDLFVGGFGIASAVKTGSRAIATIADDAVREAGEAMARQSRRAGSSGAATARGPVLSVQTPRILNDGSLTTAERALLDRAFRLKQNALRNAARRGELTYQPNTGTKRIAQLQREYRAAVQARYERLFGQSPPQLSRLDADHPVDMVVGGSPSQRLKMLHASINRSVGASLKAAARKQGLRPGELIRAIDWIH